MSSSELAWFKSSHSGTQGDSCVEVAFSRHGARTHVHVRDSKDKEGPQLTVDPAAWADFIAYVADR